MGTMRRAGTWLHEVEPLLRGPLSPLLIFVPLGLVISHAAPGTSPLLVFCLNGLAIVPLSNVISKAVEAICEHLGDQWGGCVNATAGNLVDMVIAIAALTGGLNDIVLDSMIGALITNLLLVLGISILLGGLRHRSIQISRQNTLLNSNLLLAVMLVVLVPSALHHGMIFKTSMHHFQFSVVMSFALLAFYLLSYAYQFFTHKSLFALRTKQLLEETQLRHPPGLAPSLLVLLITTIILIFNSEALVEGLSAAATQLQLSPFFTGVFLLPVFGSASEFHISIRAALQKRADLAIATTVGSSIQVMLFVLPALVIIGWLTGHHLMIFFSPQAMVCVIAAIFCIKWVTEDNNFNWFEGIFLLLIYLLLVTSSFFLA